MATLQGDSEDSRSSQIRKHCTECCDGILVCWRLMSNVVCVDF